MPKNISYRTGKDAVIYTRVSDMSQVKTGHSIKEQEPMLRKFAHEQGYNVKKVFTDEGKSATSTVGREEFMKALNYLREEKSISAFIVLDTDRLARSEHDHFLVRGFLRDNGVKLLSKNQPGIDDTAEGTLMDGIMATVNAFQSRMTGRKVSGILERLAEKGKTTGPAPLGYVNVNYGTEENPDRGVEFNPETAPLVREAFELYSTGNYSIAELVRIMTKRGLRTKRGCILQRSTMTNIINNPYYVGKIKYKDKIYKGRHKSLINDSIFQMCKAVISEHNQNAVRKIIPENHTKFFLKSALRCGICGHRITGSHVKAKGKDYYYCCVKPLQKGYHSNKGQTVSTEEIEKQVSEYFKVIELSNNVVKDVLNRAKEILIETHSGIDNEKKRLIQKNTKLEKQRQSLEVKLLDGTISDETYTRQHERIENELGGNTLKIKSISETRQDNTKLFESLAKLAHNLPSAYRNAPPEVKMMYLNIFWDRFEVKNKTIVKAVPSKVVSSMINDGLIKLQQKTPAKDVLTCNIWLLGLDSNQ